MRILRTFLLGAILLSLSSQARADTVALSELIGGKQTLIVLDPGQYNPETPDPRVRVKRLRRGSMPFWGLEFSFDLSDGTGIAHFRNAGTATLYSLTLSITPDQPVATGPELFSCGADSELIGLIPFSNCRFLQTGGTDPTTIVQFYGGPGLPSQSHFAIELDGFNSGVQVNATASATSTPEPASVALFLAGAAWVLRRSKSHQNHSV